MMKRLGDYIRPVDVRNRDLKVTRLMGINIEKRFMPSVANVVGTDLSNYKVVSKGQFACNLMHVGRDEKIPVALQKDDEPIIVSPAYVVFEVVDTNVLLTEYLMMWFSRSEFDRNAWFYTDGDVRGGMDRDALFDMQIPVPAIEKQREIVAEYNTLATRIETNKKLIATLEQTAGALYRHTFVDNIDPNNLPQGWRMGTLGEIIDVNPKLSLKKDEECSFVEMDSLPIEGYGISEITKRDFSGGAKFQNGDVLFARITPCMENGKAGVVDGLNDNEVGAGSTEFIVLRGKNISLMGLLATTVRNEEFRTYAKAHQTGSDGRQRVEASCISAYEHPIPSEKQLAEIEKDFSRIIKVCLFKSEENQTLTQMQTLLLSKMGDGNIQICIFKKKR